MGDEQDGTPTLAPSVDATPTLAPDAAAPGGVDARTLPPSLTRVPAGAAVPGPGHAPPGAATWMTVQPTPRPGGAGAPAAPRVETRAVAAAAALHAGATPPPASGAARRVGEFELLEPLGKGGMGVVYRARQSTLQRDVALKVLDASFAADAEAAERFAREARAAAAVSHPNVITIIAAGRDPATGRLYMVMELVRGGDAEQLAQRAGGKLHVRRALEVVRDAARGLGAIEKAGLVHRDIKPSNIFVTEDGVAKLADLGLARSRAGGDKVTQTGFVVGTPAYMPPEQAHGQDLDVRADIYALGATLFRLVTGRQAFDASSMMGVLTAVIRDPVPDPRSIEPTVPDHVATLILRAMAKDRRERFACAADLLAALEAALARTADPAAVTRGPTAPAPASAPPRRAAPTATPAASPPALPRDDDVDVDVDEDAHDEQVEVDEEEDDEEAAPPLAPLVVGGVALLVVLLAGGWLLVRPRQGVEPPPPPRATEPSRPATEPAPVSETPGPVTETPAPVTEAPPPPATEAPPPPATEAPPPPATESPPEAATESPPAATTEGSVAPPRATEAAPAQPRPWVAVPLTIRGAARRCREYAPNAWDLRPEGPSDLVSLHADVGREVPTRLLWDLARLRAGAVVRPPPHEGPRAPPPGVARPKPLAGLLWGDAPEGAVVMLGLSFAPGPVDERAALDPGALGVVLLADPSGPVRAGVVHVAPGAAPEAGSGDPLAASVVVARADLDLGAEGAARVLLEADERGWHVEVRVGAEVALAAEGPWGAGGPPARVFAWADVSNSRREATCALSLQAQ